MLVLLLFELVEINQIWLHQNVVIFPKSLDSDH